MICQRLAACDGHIDDTRNMIESAREEWTQFLRPTCELSSVLFAKKPLLLRGRSL